MTNNSNSKPILSELAVDFTKDFANESMERENIFFNASTDTDKVGAPNVLWRVRLFPRPTDSLKESDGSSSIRHETQECMKRSEMKSYEENDFFLIPPEDDIENLTTPDNSCHQRVRLFPRPTNSLKEFDGSSSTWNQTQEYMKRPKKKSFQEDDFFLVSPKDLEQSNEDASNLSCSGSFVLHPRPSTSSYDLFHSRKRHKTSPVFTGIADIEICSQDRTCLSQDYSCQTGQHIPDLLSTPKSIPAPLNLDV